MIAGLNPVLQALLGTLLTWGLTAAGSGLVFVFSSAQRRILDGSLGFAAGVMTAASYWSLLNPAIEMAEQSGYYGANGELAIVPVAIGFILGAAFVFSADTFLPHLGIKEPVLALALDTTEKYDKEGSSEFQDNSAHESSINIDGISRKGKKKNAAGSTRRRGQPQDPLSMATNDVDQGRVPGTPSNRNVNWRRILLLIVAITIHNIPEGLAVGVGFGAIGKARSATFENARNLAIGIGIQNFPEGLAVSLPLRGSGMSVWKSFWYGQLSGVVEPIAGLFGAIAVSVAEPILPYALAFAAGAMIYVVVDDIIPEAQTAGNGKLASWGAIVGFVVMMSLDVGLG